MPRHWADTVLAGAREAGKLVLKEDADLSDKDVAMRHLGPSDSKG